MTDHQCTCVAGPEEIVIRVNKDRWEQFTTAVRDWSEVNERIVDIGLDAAVRETHACGLPLIQAEEEFEAAVVEAAERLVESSSE